MAARPLTGLFFCITGEFGVSRDSLITKLISLGGTCMSGVTQKTNLLIVGTDPGEVKIRKANEFKIRQVGRTWLARVLKQYLMYDLPEPKFNVENV